MDYIKEIIKFNELLPQSRSLTASGINLWYALMYIFSISGWQQKTTITMNRIVSQTKLSRYTITRERERLSQLGLIRYSRPTGYYHGCYEILPLSEEMLRQIEPTLLQGETKSAASATMSAVSATMSAVPATISENAYYIDTNNNYNSNIDIQRNKENTKRKKKVKPTTTDPAKPDRKKEKSCAKKERKSAAFKQEEWLASLQEPWQGVMRQWLEYKAARKETYKTEVGARKCMTMLQNLAGGNPQVAQLIIDQSIGNNYAGLFALRQQQSTAARTQVPQTGQRIGQIKQPETEEKRQRLLERFAQASKKTDSENNQ